METPTRIERPRHQHGEPIDAFFARLDAWQSTPEGIAYREQEERELAADCARVRREAIARIVNDCGLPANMADVVSGSTSDTKAVREVSSDDFVLLVLAGPVGVGKSVAAAKWLLDPLGKPGYRPMWVSAARLSRWDRYSDEAMNKLLRASRLVIDDLYTEFADSKGSFLVTLDEVIADRAANKRPTLMTTNLDAAGFKERYGERIADRIRESGRFVVLTGESMRRKK